MAGKDKGEARLLVLLLHDGRIPRPASGVTHPPDGAGVSALAALFEQRPQAGQLGLRGLGALTFRVGAGAL